MAVSVRMEPLLEKELELAARRKGITKSQFIVDAVQRALGRKNPYELMLKVQEEEERLHSGAAQTLVDEADTGGAVPQAAEASTSMSERFRRQLKARHDASARDWLAYQDAKKRGVSWTPEDEGTSP